MKIEAAFAFPVVPVPQGAPPVGPGFSDLLAIAGPPDDGAHATSFQARGMFGRHGATAAATGEHGLGPSVVAAKPPATPDVAPKVLPAPAAAPARSSDRHSTPPRQACGSVNRQTSPTCLGSRDHAGPLSGEVKPEPENTVQGEEPHFGGASRRRTPASSLQQTWRVHLGKADEPNAAALIIRAAGLDPSEIAEFRARAQVLLRDRGLALDKVRFNGEDCPTVEAPGGRPQAWR